MQKGVETAKRSFLRKIIACVLGLLLVMGYAIPTYAEDSVEYLDANGEEKSEDNVTVIDTDYDWSDTTLSGGWYVVRGEVTVSDRIIVSGTVNLILEDGAELKAEKGISVNEGNTLTIYAQSTGESIGELIAGAGSRYAAIGGDNGNSTGTITINGGKITATGGVGGAGIGGGYNGDGGTIEINGGTIKAISTSSGYGTGAAGIGGGYDGSGGDITINDGTIEAIGGVGGAGIGGGYEGSGGDITINGGDITAVGSQGDQYWYCAGIGGGFQGSSGDIEITGGNVTATGGYTGIGGGESSDSSTGSVTISGGTVTATGGIVYGMYVNIGAYAGYGIGQTGSVTIIGGIVTATSNNGGESIGGMGTDGTSTVNYGDNGCWWRTSSEEEFTFSENGTLEIDSGKTYEIYPWNTTFAESVTFGLNYGVINVGATFSLSDFVTADGTYGDSFYGTWSSSDGSVVTVDEYGTVTGVSEGTAIITVSAINWLEDEVFAEIEITVLAVDTEDGGTDTGTSDGGDTTATDENSSDGTDETADGSDSGDSASGSTGGTTDTTGGTSDTTDDTSVSLEGTPATGDASMPNLLASLALFGGCLVIAGIALRRLRQR